MPRSPQLWTLILGFAVLHMVLAASIPVFEDEAYYQLWASAPSAAYYDHPPMVAWFIAAGQGLLGQTLLGLRLVSILAGIAVSLMIYRITWLYAQNEQTAFRAVLFGKAMLPFSILAFAATPDAGSVLFWTASVWALVEVVKGGSKNWWLLVGLFAGLGVLSKFTNLFLGLSLVIWLLASREGRARLKVWQVWLGAIIGAAVLVPLALWNFENNFVGLERQFGRIEEVSEFSAGHFVAFLLSVIFLITPLLFWLVFRAFRQTPTPKIFIWLIAPIFLFLTWQATKSVAGGQWLIPIFPLLAVLAALSAPKNWATRWAAPTGMIFGAIILILGLWPGKSLLGGHFFSQMRGWPDIHRQVLTIAKDEGATWVATDAYGLTAQLNHYLGADIPVWSVTQPERYLFRTGARKELCTQRAVFISRTRFAEAPPYFENGKALPDIFRKDGERKLMQYYVAVVSGPTEEHPYFCR